MVSPDVHNRPDTTQLLAVIHPKCNLSYNWGIESLEKSDSSASNDTSLEEVGDSSKGKQVDRFLALAFNI